MLYALCVSWLCLSTILSPRSQSYLLTISALWTAASSFWNLYSSHALNCYFQEAAVLSMLLSLVFMLFGALILKTKAFVS